jgi:hypothetical protein
VTIFKIILSGSIKLDNIHVYFLYDCLLLMRYVSDVLLFLILGTKCVADPMSNIPKDSDLYRTKQKEAKRRFEM